MKSILKKSTPLLLVLGIILSLSTYKSANANPTNPSNVKFYFHFINVGEGDAIVIQAYDSLSGQSKYILIDAGFYGVDNKGKFVDDRTGNLIEFIKKKNIKRFEYVMITHYDPDHAGGVVRLFGDKKDKGFNVTVGEIIARNYSNKVRYVEDDYGYMRSLLEPEKKLAYIGTCYAQVQNIPRDKRNIHDPEKGETINFEGAEITFLNPTASYLSKNNIKNKESLAGFVNNDSLVFRFSCNVGTSLVKRSVLFTGDFWKWDDIGLDNLKCDILKSSHHGRKYSNSAKPIDRVAGVIAICGPNRSSVSELSNHTGNRCQFGIKCDINSEQCFDPKGKKVYATCVDGSSKGFILRFMDNRIEKKDLYGEWTDRIPL